jgi:hypothetical protein
VKNPCHTSLDLRFARVGVLADEKTSWPPEHQLFLNGLVYSDFGDRSPTDAESRLRWVRSQRKTHFRPQPYEQLAAVLRKHGLEADAAKVLFEKNRDQAKYTQQPLRRRTWNAFLNITVGYGYRPVRALLWSLLIVVLGAHMFQPAFDAGTLVDSVSPAGIATDLTPGSLPTRRGSSFCSLIYSVDTFVPLVDLGEDRHWTPDPNRGRPLFQVGWFEMRYGEVLRYYLVLQRLFGWVFTTLLIAALSGLIRR